MTVTRITPANPHRPQPPEDMAILRRAGKVMGIPPKVVGAVGGSFWVDPLEHAPGTPEAGNVKGKIWDAWNPLRKREQAMELIAKNKFNVFWLEPTSTRPSWCVVVDDTYIDFDKDTPGDDITALCRAAVVATAMKSTLQ